jgi:creatinine amidohydrolase
MPTAMIARMTWEDFRDRVDAHSVAVIPIGSVELEGPHLPLGVDTLTAEAVARGLDGAPGVLIGPTLPVGYSKWFMPIAGTISLEMETLIRVLSDYAGSLIAHGVRRILFLNAHRGNNAAIEAVAHSLIAEKMVRVAMINIWKQANDLAAAPDSGIAEGRFTHAGEVMTSVIMALAPEAVKADRIRADRVASPPGSAFKVRNSLGETEFDGSVQILFQDIRQVTGTGTMGDPGPASAAKGGSLIQAITAYSRNFVAELRKLGLESDG